MYATRDSLICTYYSTAGRRLVRGGWRWPRRPRARYYYYWPVGSRRRHDGNYHVRSVYTVCIVVVYRGHNIICIYMVVKWGYVHIHVRITGSHFRLVPIRITSYISAYRNNIIQTCIFCVYTSLSYYDDDTKQLEKNLLVTCLSCIYMYTYKSIVTLLLCILLYIIRDDRDGIGRACINRAARICSVRSL